MANVDGREEKSTWSLEKGKLRIHISYYIKYSALWLIGTQNPSVNDNVLS